MATKKRAVKTGGARTRLVILDSHAIIHRAYHALPDFSTSKGEPSGALYGLVAMLLKIAEDLAPDHLVAARDLPGPTHRHQLFEAYKATRAEADQEIIDQLKKAPDIFAAFGIPVYAAPGYEADDVVATIVRAVHDRDDIETIIATGDLDTLQLVGPRTRVFTLRKGLTDTVVYDEDAVRERYGFGPEHIVDYKALRGDPSDNYPGVRGIGEKTASELIGEYGSVEAIYGALDSDRPAFEKKCKPRIVQLLLDGRADAASSKELAMMHADVPVDFTLSREEWRLADHALSIEAMCDRFEFRSLKERFRSQLHMGGAARESSPEPKTSAVAIDKRAVRETSIALWLLHSDLTNPDLDDILHAANTDDFEKAREHIFAELHDAGRLRDVYERIERPLIPVVERMNEDGVFIDVPYMKSLAREYGKDLADLAGRIHRHAGHEFNINSPKQLGVVLYDELKLNPPRQKRTAGGQRTTREDELAKLSDMHPVIDEILAYRELQKLLSTYVEKMPALTGEDGRLHAEFVQAGTTTGRMSSQNPNLQNIPVKTESGRRIRSAFAAPRGRVIIALDYSQIELRIAAGLSGDEKLVETFRRGGDIHAAVAAEVFDVPPEQVDREMRRRAKVINFGILYGMGVGALRVNLGGAISREEAAQYLSKYFSDFAGLARYIELVKTEAAARGYTETLFGRRRYFPALKSALPNLRAQAERMAINAPIQGTQADIIKLAMVEADALIGREGWRGKAKLVLQVHDELVYELDQDIAQDAARAIRAVMESVAPIEKLSGVPILAEASMGPTWGDREKLDR